MDHVENLDAIQDDFIHYQLFRFCQATRLQYLNNAHILRINALCNSNMLIAK